MNRSVLPCLILLASCAEPAVREPIATATAPSRTDPVYMICAHDRDGDHVPDLYDRCDLVKGERATDGCHDALEDSVTDLHGFDVGSRRVESCAVQFTPGTSTLAPSSGPELDRLVKAWRESSTSPIEMYDVLGPRDVPSTAEARVRAVEDALAQRGVAGVQLTVSAPWCAADASEGFVRLSADLSPKR